MRACEWRISRCVSWQGYPVDIFEERLSYFCFVRFHLKNKKNSDFLRVFIIIIIIINHIPACYHPCIPTLKLHQTRQKTTKLAQKFTRGPRHASLICSIFSCQFSIEKQKMGQSTRDCHGNKIKIKENVRAFDCMVDFNYHQFCLEKWRMNSLYQINLLRPDWIYQNRILKRKKRASDLGQSKYPLAKCLKKKEVFGQKKDQSGKQELGISSAPYGWPNNS